MCYSDSATVNVLFTEKRTDCVCNLWGEYVSFLDGHKFGNMIVKLWFLDFALLDRFKRNINVHNIKLYFEEFFKNETYVQ